MKKIIPFLWFNNNVDEAVSFYTSIFKENSVSSISPGPDGKAFSAIFNLEGQEFYALNGGPMYSFTPAVSFFINCETQEEVDYYWDKLSEGGREDRCGWLVDPFGLSWQVVPTILGKYLGDSDREKAGRVMQAMLKMAKLDIAELQNAYDGK